MVKYQEQMRDKDCRKLAINKKSWQFESWTLNLKASINEILSVCTLIDKKRAIQRTRNETAIVKLTSRMWFCMVCNLIDSDTRHHSGQNVMDSRGAAATNIKDNEKNNIKDNEKKSFSRFVDNWKHRLGLESARAPLCKWATGTPQTSLWKTFENTLNMQKQYETDVWEAQWCVLVVNKSTDHDKHRKHIPPPNIYALPAPSPVYRLLHELWFCLPHLWPVQVTQFTPMIKALWSAFVGYSIY